MKDIRVLLCGTVFGEIYLRGILDSDKWKLKGILSKGSERSAELARENEVPLYTDVKNVPEGEFDIAFVVVRSGIVGGEGSKIAGCLLDKHISVIQEQPVHADEVAELYKKARRNGVSYRVNTFYPYMESSKAFHLKLEELKKKEEILSIDGACSMPILLPYIDQLGRIAGGLRPWSIDRVFNNEVYDLVCGKVREIPFSIRIQGRKNNNDSQAFLLNQINVMTSSGNLIMTDVNGQVIWLKKPYIVENYIRSKDENCKENSMVSRVLYDAGERHFSDIYDNTWPKAIKNFLFEYEEETDKDKDFCIDMQYYLAVCGFWKELYKRLEDIG